MEENNGEQEEYISNRVTKWGYEKIVDNYVKNTKGYARDVIVSSFYYQLLQDGKEFDFVRSHLPDFNKTVGNEYMRNEIYNTLVRGEQWLKDYSSATISHTNFVPVNSADSLFDKIVEKYRGKVVYVDFWGTWCIPCLEEMPNSKALYKTFNGKDIIFLFLGVQSNEKVWKATIAEKQIPGEHYLLKDTEYNVLKKKFNITGVPHYLIVDKRGYVKDSNASRPGDKNVKKDLDDLL